MSSEEEDNAVGEKESFDTDVFISSIKNLPCIWNYKTESYRNKSEKNEAWASICEIFTPNFEEKSTKEKNNIAIQLQKKWKLLRDNFNRYKKKSKTMKRGSIPKPCTYYQQLLFLKDLSEDRGERSSNFYSAPDRSPSEEKMKNTTILRTIKCETPEIHDEELIDNLTTSVNMTVKEEEDQIDEDKYFLLSLCSDFKKIPENLKLDAKGEIINIIKKYRT